jgi:predicted deacetylase
MKKKALIALHDTAPFHLSRILKAEDCLNQWGVTKFNCLFVPDYHHQNNKRGEDEHRLFMDWTQRERALEMDWILHGLYHERDPAIHTKKTILNWLRGSIRTDKEAEFLDVSEPEIRSRLETGMGIFEKAFGFSPRVFISPAWLYKEELVEVLKELNFDFTEDHKTITALKTGKKFATPVISWSTRTAFRKQLSNLGCRVLAQRWSYCNLIRIALHPPDFDFPSVIRSIFKVIQSVLAERELLLYRDLNRVFDVDSKEN